MSLHLTILLWLGIIFVIAASIILGLLLKSKEERKESYLGFTVIFYILDLLYSSTFIFGILYRIKEQNDTVIFVLFIYIYIIFINNSSNMIY